MIDYESKLRIKEADFSKAAFTRKWKVAGVTEIEAAMTKAEITIDIDEETEGMVAACAMKHEIGHVLVASDIAENDGDFETLTSYDRWQNEVEAWVRGVEDSIDNNDGHLLRFHHASMMLDALNSYRRGLNVSDEDWEAARELLFDVVQPRDQDAFAEYVPIEPDPDEPPPCSGHFKPVPVPRSKPPEPDEEDEDDEDEEDEPDDDEEDEEDVPDEETEDEAEADSDEDDDDAEDEDDDESDSDEDDDDSDDEADDEDEDDSDSDDGDADEEDDEPEPDDEEDEEVKQDDEAEARSESETTSTMDDRWLDPTLIGQLMAGADPEQLATEHGLDTGRMPPLAAAAAQL